MGGSLWPCWGSLGDRSCLDPSRAVTGVASSIGLLVWHSPHVSPLSSTRELYTTRVGGTHHHPSSPPCRNKSGHVGPCLQDPSRAGTCTVHRSEFWSSYRLNITEVNPLGSSFRLLDITMQAISECPSPLSVRSPTRGVGTRPDGVSLSPPAQLSRTLRRAWWWSPSPWPRGGST